MRLIPWSRARRFHVRLSACRLISRGVPLALAMALATGTLEGQTVTLGWKGGVVSQLTWYSGGRATDSKATGTPTLGFRANRHWGVDFEYHAWTQTDSWEDPFGPVQGSVHYVQLPVSLRYMMPIEGSPILPVAFAGGWVAKRTRCSYQDHYESDTNCGRTDTPAATLTGYFWGGGLMLPAGPAQLSIELRGEARQSPIVPRRYLNRPTTHQNGIGVLLGAAVPFGRKYPMEASPHPRASLPAGVTAQLQAGDRVRVMMVDALVTGQVVGVFDDSLVLANVGRPYPPRFTIDRLAIQHIDASLGRQSRAKPMALGFLAGCAAALITDLTASIHQDYFEMRQGSRPMLVAFPVIGAVGGYVMGRERWQEAAMPRRAGDR